MPIWTEMETVITAVDQYTHINVSYLMANDWVLEYSFIQKVLFLYQSVKLRPNPIIMGL